MEFMRAVVLDRYGDADVLSVQRRPIPVPLPTEVRVRVAAAGVNPVDWKTRTGAGMAAVLGEPPLVPGGEVSGVVAGVGGGVPRFAVGAPVFGMPWFPRQAGASAEYVPAPSRPFAARPDELDEITA